MGVAEHATVLDDLPVGGDVVENAEQDGGKRRRGRKGSKSRRGTKKRGSKKRGTKKRGSKKRGASPWILHVKAFCKKTGKNFPQALKDPMCRKTFKR